MTLRELRLKVLRLVTKRVDVYSLKVWQSALEREDSVRAILGARRSESTDDAAIRVVYQAKRMENERRVS